MQAFPYLSNFCFASLFLPLPCLSCPYLGISFLSFFRGISTPFPFQSSHLISPPRLLLLYPIQTPNRTPISPYIPKKTIFNQTQTTQFPCFVLVCVVCCITYNQTPKQPQIPRSHLLYIESHSKKKSDLMYPLPLIHKVSIQSIIKIVVPALIFAPFPRPIFADWNFNALGSETLAQMRALHYTRKPFC